MNKSVFIYGPKGCGKTRNAKRIAAAFGLSKIVDDYDEHYRERMQLTDTLYLSNAPAEQFAETRRAYSFMQAMDVVARHEGAQA